MSTVEIGKLSEFRLTCQDSWTQWNNSVFCVKVYFIVYFSFKILYYLLVVNINPSKSRQIEIVGMSESKVPFIQS